MHFFELAIASSFSLRIMKQRTKFPAFATELWSRKNFTLNT